MPPSAAPEWLRVGCSFEMTATSAPASCASMAARIPAQPAPTTRTSCVVSTWTDATETPGPEAAVARPESELGTGGANGGPDVGEALLEVVREELRQLACLAVVGLGVAPRRPRVEELRLDGGDRRRDLEAEQLVGPERRVVELARE